MRCDKVLQKKNKMKNVLRFILVSFLFSCHSSQETKFEKSGISFTCPSGWKITDEENLNDAGYYLSCEKEGLNSSGLLTISWVNDSMALTEMLEIHKAEMEKNIVLKHSDLTFGNGEDAKFKDYNSKSVNFSTTLLGLKSEGMIYCFYANGKTITILRQEAIEDKSDNSEGFKIIENSFLSK